MAAGVAEITRGKERCNEDRMLDEWSQPAVCLLELRCNEIGVDIGISRRRCICSSRKNLSRPARTSRVDRKDGGSIELACMSEDEKAAFFDYARDCGMWDWTKTEECHCDRACIGEPSGTRRLGGVHRRHPERDGDRKSFVRQGLESVTGTEESVS
jgi:hypothetical protein